MSKPNKKDLRRLKSIESMADNLSSAYSGLTEGTKEFLLKEFTGETKLHLLKFHENISETIEEIKSFKNKESKYFEISGYFKDDRLEFSGYIVKELNDIDEDEEDKIFYYGLSEWKIRRAIERGEDSDLDFVITNYSKIEQP